MSTATTAPRSSFARIPAAFKLQFVVKTTFVTVPLFVFFSAWAIAVGILWWIHLVSDRGESGGSFARGMTEGIYSGASQAALWCLVFMAAYAASHTFPFAMALSFSRRVYLLGAFLAFTAVSLGFGTLFGLAALFERLTDGYGFHAYNFDLPFLTESAGIVGASILAAALCLLLMLVGFTIAILYRRLGLALTWTVLLGLGVVIAVIAMLITTNDGWPMLGDWYMDQTALTLALWLIPGVVLLGGASYALIRKATPA